jgi:hypothetical protein
LKYALFILVLLTSPLSSSAQSNECFPECRDGYLCHEGACIEACNPPCAEGKTCSSEGQCVKGNSSPNTTVAPIPDGNLLSFGVGPALGEFYGGIMELEIDMRSLAVQIETGGGINADANPCIYGGLVVGKRIFYESETSTRWTFLYGANAAYLSEGDQYEYLLLGAKLMTGYTTFSGQGATWGIDFCFRVGYRLQISEEKYGENYSGLSGGLEARYRFGF